MRRFVLLFVLPLIAVLAVLCGVACYLLQDESFVKHRLSAYTLRVTGRPLRIEGPVDIKLGRVTTVEAHGLRYPNADWAGTGDMIRIGHLRFALDIPSLFDDLPLLPRVLIEDCAVNLESNAQGEANWRVFPKRQPQHEQPGGTVPFFILLAGQINNCSYTQDSPQRKAPLQVQVDQFSLQLLQGQKWQGGGSGALNGEPLTLSGQLEPPGALIAGRPLRYDVTLQAGTISLQSKGSIQNPHTGAGSSLRARFTGPDIVKVIDYFRLPPFSSGPFDFRLGLDNQGQMTGLSIDGDLGALTLQAKGQLDRLRKPTRGQVSFKASGPDLQALGATLGVEDLVKEAFKAAGEVTFELGRVRFAPLTVDTAYHHGKLTGTLGDGHALADSDFHLELASDELGRWAALIGRPEGKFGKVTATGRLWTDARGSATVEGSIAHLGNDLKVSGRLGTLGERFHPDLRIDFHANDVSPLVALLSDYRMPSAATAVRGRVAWLDRRLTLDQVTVDVGGHKSTADGIIDLSNGFIGSHMAFELDSPDLAALGHLFGRESLPAVPFKASGGVAKPDDALRLDKVQVQAGTIDVQLSGHLNSGGGYDLDVRAQGQDAAEFGNWFRQTLPSSPFTITTNVAGNGQALKLSKLDARLGRSQGSGDLDITLGQRKQVEGELAFPLLDLSWLESRNVGQHRKEEDKRTFVFDDTEVARVADIGFDLRLRLAIEQLQLATTRLQQMDVGMLLSGPRVEIDPFSLKGPSGGQLSGRFTLDTERAKPVFHLELNGEDVALGLALAKGQDVSTYPHAKILVRLDTVGMTRREMASSLDGKLRLELGPGQVARSGAEFLQTDLVSQLLKELNPFAAKDDFTRFECGVAGAVISDGQMKVLPLVLQMKQVTILSQGTIDLRTEQIDMSFNSKPRQGLGISASAVINPFIKVGNTLARPAIVLDPGGALVGGGTAVATLGVSVVAKSFYDRFLSSRDPCGDARKEIAKQDAGAK